VLSQPVYRRARRLNAALTRAPLSEQTRRTYASKVRQYLAWLADADTEGDPLGARDARDWAVRDYRTHLQTILKRKPATVNNALAAVDDPLHPPRPRTRERRTRRALTDRAEGAEHARRGAVSARSAEVPVAA
jgi:hypothetical protein